MGTAGFDREEDLWPKRWAEAYVAFAAGEKRDWLRAMGHRIFPVVGWAERGGYDAMGHGNSVPRFHVTWGTGPGIVEPFERRAREAEARAANVQVSPSRRCACDHQRHGRRCQRFDPRTNECQNVARAVRARSSAIHAARRR
jgi:predicted oxidoreductase